MVRIVVAVTFSPVSNFKEAAFAQLLVYSLFGVGELNVSVYKGLLPAGRGILPWLRGRRTECSFFNQFVHIAVAHDLVLAVPSHNAVAVFESVEVGAVDRRV